ncbi:MAG: alpha/beta fold hydrolase [Gemmatimonadaceae bacterium]|nr:alpha/beta fold hydrolase [Gemmatimonadaceae bacterium]
MKTASQLRALTLFAALSVPSLASAQVTVTAATVDTTPPSTVRESSYPIKSGMLTLPGTLTLPAAMNGKIPVVLIVAGSGPTDRNGNSVAPGYSGPLPRPNMYAQLAWRLAEQGIASVRYDKRSLGENLKRIVIANTSWDDFVNDVTAGAKQLSSDARFSRVVLLGHSEGAGLALEAANRGAQASAIIMASGAGRKYLPIIHEQLTRQLDPATLLAYDSAMATYLRGGTPSANLPGALMSLLHPDNRKFMQGAALYDPPTEIARVKLPVLIVQGAYDGQTSLDADAKVLAAAQPAAKLVVLPKANHVLKAATGPQLATQVPLYMDPRSPIVPEIATTIAAWIKALH